MAKSKQAKGRGWLRALGLVVVILILLMVLIPIGLVAAVSESKPMVTGVAQVSTQSAVQAKWLATRFYRGLSYSYPKQPSRISASEKELSEIVALAVRGINNLKGRVEVTPGEARAEFSLHLPYNPFGKYVNASLVILPSTDGLQVKHLKVGHLTLPGRSLIPILESLLNRAIDGEAIGSELLASIEAVQLDDGRVALTYHSVPNFKQKLKKIKGQVVSTQGETEQIRRYYRQLCVFQRSLNSVSKPSLAVYLRNLFEYSEQQTQLGRDAVSENRAALLALAIFLGNQQFDRFVGIFEQPSAGMCRPLSKGVLLAKRDDLRLHFIFSAAFKIISSSGISFSIGEFKELLDSQLGSSGFSFADLAADRAGIRFAELAVDSQGAIHLQELAATLMDENTFFPSIEALPEGISQHKFEQRGGIESAYYAQYLRDIETRIDKLKIYQKK